MIELEPPHIVITKSCVLSVLDHSTRGGKVRNHLVEEVNQLLIQPIIPNECDILLFETLLRCLNKVELPVKPTIMPQTCW